MPNNPRRLSPAEVRRIQLAEKTLKELQKILRNNYIYIIQLPQIQEAFNKGNDSISILSNRIAMRSINAYLRSSAAKFNAVLLNAIQEEWKLTAPELWKGLRTIYAKDLKQIKVFEQLKDKAVKSAREYAANSQKFYNEKRSGLRISDRVWRLHQNIPAEIEALVQNSIKEGKSSDALSKDLNKYLNKPDRIFRRVKNKKTGKQEWSKAAQEYHPGRGIYRSSYKNAMRLARTEINRGYRRAEWEAYQGNNQIYGYQIVLSNNTENQCEVCKQLAGVYPKWFLWTGWHPQCRCRMVPVLMPRSDWQQLLKLRFEGRESEFKPNIIQDLPPQFVEYLKESVERIRNSASVPYWFADNEERLRGIF